MSSVDELLELLELSEVRIETDEWVMQRGKENTWLVCRNGVRLRTKGAIALEYEEDFGYALFVFGECIHGRHKEFTDAVDVRRRDEDRHAYASAAHALGCSVEELKARLKEQGHEVDEYE